MKTDERKQFLNALTPMMSACRLKSDELTVSMFWSVLEDLPLGDVLEGIKATLREHRGPPPSPADVRARAQSARRYRIMDAESRLALSRIDTARLEAGK